MKNALKTPSAPSPALVNESYHRDEDAAVSDLLAQVDISPEGRGRIRNNAYGFVQTIRANRRRFGGLDRFLQEFGLTTDEGIALMCLAEALLRIPDGATADKLIRDKIGGADWDKHLGKADDLFVNASTWALMLTGKVIGDARPEAPASVAGRIVARVGEPVVRQAMLHSMKIMGQQFVTGRTIEEALKRAVDVEKDGSRHSYDMLGEGARTTEDAERYFKSYEAAIDAIGKAAAGRGPVESSGISVKLSALHPRYEYAQREKCVPELAAKLLTLAQKCAHYDIALAVDAEEARRLEISLEIVERVFAHPSLGSWEGFGFVVQAYQKRCGAVIDHLAGVAERAGRRMMVRLVKGAYWDSEVKYAQVYGLPGYPVFTRKNATDVSYIVNAKKLLDRRDIFYPMFGTHNALTVATVIELAGKDQTGFEFQRLHGMAEPLYHQITGRGEGKYLCRIYAPVGEHRDLLPYLVRRLLENGANVNFINRLQDDKMPIDEILADPVEYIAGLESKPHPKIPLPAGIYGTRRNSAGVEFADGMESGPLLDAVVKAADDVHTAKASFAPKKDGAAAFDPADNRRQVGTVHVAEKDGIEAALKAAHGAFPAWKATPAEERAACLERAADMMEEQMAELLALCAREAGKTLPDGVAEVREAVDFCRYYAIQGRALFGAPEKMPGPTGESNELFMEGRGVFLCISPWNFPLAIFMGQVTAALMAGNTVIAKPAGQTCLIAAKAVDILHAAGVPKEALVFLPVPGRLAGELLVPDARIAGVCMTGSTETAQTINRTLAERPGPIVPFIAETGGQNAMIVDSSALPEQVVDDIITSAFRSAGQRCSALRVLYIQEGIADKVIEMLKGACAHLVMGDPIKLSTDIGPVIDEAAKKTLEEHAARMEKEGALLVQVPEGKETAHGSFFAPRAYEIKSISQLPKEVFGPVLHVIRFRGGEMEKVIEEINSTGYGLTCGVHTRIGHVAEMLTKRVSAGNCYVNRSMIGAVVGVQPFGGNGLSGTGPKAGGPHYLLRFAAERTVTVDTTANGGNTTLVSLGEA